MSLRGEVRDLAIHRRERERLRREAIEMRRARSVRLGERVTVVFECRRSVLFQLHEALLAAHGQGAEAAEEEIARHEAICPDASALTATVYLEIGETTRIREDLEALASLDQGEHLRLELGGGAVVGASFLSLPSEEGRLPAARRVRFVFRSDALRLFRDSREPAHLVLDHPISRARVPVVGAMRDRLRMDLAESAGASSRGERSERLENRRSGEGA